MPFPRSGVIIGGHVRYASRTTPPFVSPAQAHSLSSAFMSDLFRMEFAASSDTGRLRTHNEDAVVCDPAHRLAIVADGMGGHSGGEVASSIAAQTVRDAIAGSYTPWLTSRWLPAPVATRRIARIVSQAVTDANRAVRERAEREPCYRGMGTTLVAAMFHRRDVAIAHVGDSRAYRLRNRELLQLTHDHSCLQEEIDAGLLTPEQARSAPNKNLITRAVGAEDAIRIDIARHSVEAGDRFLLCSDGLSDMLAPDRIRDIVVAHADLPTACAALIREANASGGHDNVSAVLVDVMPAGAPAPEHGRRWFG